MFEITHPFTWNSTKRSSLAEMCTMIMTVLSLFVFGVNERHTCNYTPKMFTISIQCTQ